MRIHPVATLFCSLLFVAGTAIQGFAVPITSVNTYFSRNNNNNFQGLADGGGTLKAANRTDTSPTGVNNRALRGFVFFEPTADQKLAVLNGVPLSLSFDLDSITNFNDGGAAGTGDLNDLEIRFKGRGNLIAVDAWNFGANATFTNVLTPSSTPGTYSLDVSSISGNAGAVNQQYWLFSFVTPDGRHVHGANSTELYNFDASSAALNFLYAPEPSTFVLGMLSIGGLGFVRRRRRR